MGNSLNVDPVDLHMSSDHINVHHAELTAAHTAADGEIEGTQAGWVGASAAALHSKMTKWQSTTKLCGDIAAEGAAKGGSGELDDDAQLGQRDGDLPSAPARGRRSY